jgi:SAM-dependent methyltransferase
MPLEPRYELFGWDYPLISPLAERAVAWYLRFAKQTGGPVLELACGTGRLLARLAAEGFAATGLDLSDKMLALARQQIDALPPKDRNRVQLVRANMKDFSFHGEFGLICLADNSFRVLLAREDQLACLARVRQHLRFEASSPATFLMTER